jgi:hypothetical protein
MKRAMARLLLLTAGFLLAVSGTVLAFLVISVCLAQSGGGDHPPVWLLVGWGILAVLLWIAGAFTMFKAAK